jgi:hypothetical protein
MTKKDSTDWHTQAAAVKNAAPSGAGVALSAESFGDSGHGVMDDWRGLDLYTRIKSLQFMTD